MTFSRVPHLVRSAVHEVGDLVWPASCAGCGAWGSSLCTPCRRALVPRPVVADAVWLPGFPVHAAAPFEGPLRRIITAYKDEGRSDLRPWLSRLLGSAAAAALRSTERRLSGWLVVTVPSSRAAIRRRGCSPVEDLATALHRPGLTAGPVLRLQRRVQDQSSLGRVERLHNLRDAYRLVGDAPITARTGVLLVDDVVTTGATLRAALLAVSAANPAVVRAATVAATGGRVGQPAAAEESRGRPDPRVRKKCVEHLVQPPRGR